MPFYAKTNKINVDFLIPWKAVVSYAGFNKRDTVHANSWWNWQYECQFYCKTTGIIAGFQFSAQRLYMDVGCTYMSPDFALHGPSVPQEWIIVFIEVSINQ